MRPRLVTPRLRLRQFVLADAAELHVLFSDPLTHTVGSGPFTSTSQTERWISNRIDAQRDHGLCWYALRDVPSTSACGSAGPTATNAAPSSSTPST